MKHFKFSVPFIWWETLPRPVTLSWGGSRLPVRGRSLATEDAVSSATLDSKLVETGGCWKVRNVRELAGLQCMLLHAFTAVPDTKDTAFKHYFANKTSLCLGIKRYMAA
jgi:hypothetical protein